MFMDCMACPVRGQRCDGCVVTALLPLASSALPLDAAESSAVSMLVGVGLVRADAAANLHARPEAWGTFRHVG
jgi:hypothetical protein